MWYMPPAYVGRLSDVHGHKLALMISIAASFLGYGASCSIWQHYMSASVSICQHLAAHSVSTLC